LQNAYFACYAGIISFYSNRISKKSVEQFKASEAIAFIPHNPIAIDVWEGILLGAGKNLP